MGLVCWVRALIHALELQIEVVHQVGREQLQLASPCEGWTVHQVLNHSIGVTLKFADFASGATDAPHAPPGDLVRLDHRGAVRDAVIQARTAWISADMSRTCRLGFGTFPAKLAAGINLFDVLAHTWDIAATVGVQLNEDNDIWLVGLHAARQLIGPERDPLHYAAAIPITDAAPPMGRFLAFLGRSVHPS